MPASLIAVRQFRKCVTLPAFGIADKQRSSEKSLRLPLFRQGGARRIVARQHLVDPLVLGMLVQAVST